mgnify:CR=1 FL=1
MIPSSSAAFWRGVLVALVAAFIWIAHFDRWSVDSWQLPTDYVGDAHETLARLKAASEGDIIPLRSQVITRLGAPFGAHWNAYPTPDKPLMLALGALVHAVGLYGAANLGMLLAQVSAALAFYLVARWLRCRWEWAAAGALLFAYTYHTFHRGLAHFSLIFTWTIPVGLLAVWLIARSQRLEWRRPGAIVCLGAGVALGSANPYNLFFWLQLIGWALILQSLGDRRKPNLQIGVATIGIALAAFLIVHAEAWLYTDNPDALPLLTRNYSGTEIYALKAVEMVIPPPFHRWDWLAFFGHRYLRWSEWRGEAFLPYLGLVGIAGAIWLAVTTVRSIVQRRPLPGQTLSIGWILAYASLGGVTNFLALFAGFQIFRATNRAAIFISAIVLFFLAVRLSHATKNWPGWLRLSAAMLVAGIGVFEQLPGSDSRTEMATIARAVEADAAFGQALEAQLPTGAMVFQLPVLGFPEIVPPYQLTDYEHFRPYLVTDQLRFSYGGPKYRARGRWQRDLEGMSLDTLIPALESHGFAALYLNRKGFKDGAEQLLEDLKKLGYHARIQSENGQQIAIPLRSVERPEPPLANALTLGRGWHLRPDAGVRWAFEDAFLSYFNPHSQSTPLSIKLTLVGISPRMVTIEHDGKGVRDVEIGPDPTEIQLPGHLLQPGINRFKLRCPTGPTRAGSGSNRQLRSFGLKESRVTPSFPGSEIPTDPATPKRPPRLAGNAPADPN